MIDREGIAALVREIRQQFQPLKVILFGSYARGEARADSDLNLCLVVSEAGEWLERHAEFRRRIDPPGVLVQPVIYSAGELERLGAEGHPFVREILEEGKVLYERRRA
jgi:predicted nucleotidyltransferase